MIYIDRGTTYWSSHFRGETGTPYFASLIPYTESSCICIICFIPDNGIPNVVYHKKLDGQPSSQIMKHCIENFLGYKINAMERSISKI